LPLQAILWISLGSIVGGNLRYFVARLTTRLIPSGFPYGTLVVNVTGSLVLGFFLVWTTERVFADPRWRLLIAIGFCGGYTTYSGFAYETFALFEQGQWAASAVNLLLTNVLCTLAVLLGAILARSL